MTTRRTLLALPLLISLLVAGCSDDKPAASPEASPTSAAASPSASASPETSVDAAIAAKINLTAADLQQDLAATPAEPPSESDRAAERALYACMGVSPTDPFGDDVSSPSFSSPLGLQIASSVDVYPTAGEMQAEFSAFSGPKALGCLRTSIETRLRTQAAPSGGTIKDSALVRAKALEVVPDSLGFHFTTTATSGSDEAKLNIDLVAIRRGRIAVQITALGVGSDFPRALLTKATQAVATRAAAQAQAG